MSKFDPYRAIYDGLLGRKSGASRPKFKLAEGSGPLFKNGLAIQIICFEFNEIVDLATFLSACNLCYVAEENQEMTLKLHSKNQTTQRFAHMMACRDSKEEVMTIIRLITESDDQQTLDLIDSLCDLMSSTNRELMRTLIRDLEDMKAKRNAKFAARDL